MITIEKLKKASKFSIRQLAVDLDMKYQKLYAKLYTNSELDVILSERISEVLKEKYGIEITD